MSPRAIQVSVIGASEPDPDLERLAREVGGELAGAGAVLICGGLTGVMDAAAQGAEESGGITVAVLPGTDTADANPHVTHAVATGTGHARNLAVAASGDAVIAIGGEWGTLSEIAFARKLGTPVVTLESWSLTMPSGAEASLVPAASASEAVELALSLARPEAASDARTESAEQTLD